MDPLMEQPLDEIRERFGVSPEGMLVNNPTDRWCGEMGPVTERESSDIVKQKGLNFD